MELTTLLAIGEIIAKFGVPMALSILETWDINGEPTLEDITRLRAMVPEPKTYFKDE